TFRDESTGKLSKTDFAVMLGIPVALGIGAYLLCFEIPDQYVGTLISVFAIFSGLLFNVLVLIYSFSGDDFSGDKETRDELLKQSFSNISFSILISLLIVVVLPITLFIDGTGGRILECFALALSANFFLSLLMVLKRMHILLSNK